MSFADEVRLYVLVAYIKPASDKGGHPRRGEGPDQRIPLQSPDGAAHRAVFGSGSRPESRCRVYPMSSGLSHRSLAGIMRAPRGSEV